MDMTKTDASCKYDQMAARKDQKYYFIFVHEDGVGLERISETFAKRHIEASVDEVLALEDVNRALKEWRQANRGARPS